MSVNGYALTYWMIDRSGNDTNLVEAPHGVLSHDVACGPAPVLSRKDTLLEYFPTWL